MSHHDRFRRAGRLHKGYHRRQVDAFLNHVEVSLSGVFPTPTASEVRQVGFELEPIAATELQDALEMGEQHLNTLSFAT